jgi:hypothetical protein
MHSDRTRFNWARLCQAPRGLPNPGLDAQSEALFVFRFGRCRHDRWDETRVSTPCGMRQFMRQETEVLWLIARHTGSNMHVFTEGERVSMRARRQIGGCRPAVHAHGVRVDADQRPQKASRRLGDRLRFDSRRARQRRKWLPRFTLFARCRDRPRRDWLRLKR